MVRIESVLTPKNIAKIKQDVKDMLKINFCFEADFKDELDNEKQTILVSYDLDEMMLKGTKLQNVKVTRVIEKTRVKRIFTIIPYVDRHGKDSILASIEILLADDGECYYKVNLKIDSLLLDIAEDIIEEQGETR